MRLIRLLKNDLAKEIDSWVDAEIISSDQAKQICACYGIDYPLSSSNRAYHYLMGFAYLFLALALIILIGHNWDEMGRGLRMAGLITITLATHGVAFYQWRQDKAFKAHALFALANMFYGASIILIAQIYHLGEHMPDGVFWWALGCLPFALITKSRLLMLQTMILAVIWFFMETSLGFYPTAFPLFLGATFYLLYKGQSSLILFFIFILGIGFWFEYSLMFLWRDNFYPKFLYENAVTGVSLAILFYALSKRLTQSPSSIANDYGALLGVWIMRFGVLTLLILSFEYPWKRALRYDWQSIYSMFFVIIFLNVSAFFLVKEKQQRILVAIFSLMQVLLTLFVANISDKQFAVIFQILDNIMLIAAGIYLINKGLEQNISHYFFFGIITILLTALLRYFDLIGDYIGGALLFAFFAVLLIISAKLFWRRQNSTKERL